MKLKTVALIGASLLLAATPSWSATIYGGFEDTVGGDYDYNDLVFSLSGTALTMIAPGASLYAKPTLNGGTNMVGAHNGVPFWNNQSADGASDNVGYCIYGGGTCNGGTGLDPSADYLAASSNGSTSTTGSANNVTFSVDGGVSTNVSITITSDHDVLGWYSTSSPGTIHWLDNTGPVTGTFTFAPGGTFGLVGNNDDAMGGNTYYSQTADGNASDTVSHFAFFENASTPEPSTFLLLGAGFLALGGIRRRPAFLSRFGKS